MSINVLSAQKTEAKLYFKDGSELIGFAKFKGKDRIKFKETKKNKAIIYNWEDLHKITLTKPGSGRYHFYYKKIKETDTFKPLQLVSDGKIMLYRVVTKGYDIKYSNGANAGVFANDNGVPQTTRTEIENFYISKAEEDVIDISYGSEFFKNFRETSMSFFADCKEIVAKIEEGTYTINDIRDIVFYYNFKCG
ncbi:hypothetical protein D1815_10170 [Aquimarina sp. AD1]|nr:hypothetical protein D1815_10170 [Aquimarina sp. AD1]RKN03674.1 hypothetical protein D7035_22155 [Aquimarina sp. AD1]